MQALKFGISLKRQVDVGALQVGPPMAPAIENDLFEIFLKVIKEGEDARIDNMAYLEMFGLGVEPLTAGELWGFLLPDIRAQLPVPFYEIISKIIAHGSLSTRIGRALGTNPTADRIKEVYRQLANCLHFNHLFE